MGRDGIELMGRDGIEMASQNVQKLMVFWGGQGEQSATVGLNFPNVP